MSEGAGPLILADGTAIDIETGMPIVPVVHSDPAPTHTYVEVPTHEEAQRTVVATRRRLSDLPEPPRKMNLMSAVLSYTLFGLSDFDIAVALNITEDQVGRVKMLDAYSELQETVVNSIRESDTSDVRNLFVQHSRQAAHKVIEIANSGSGALAFAAARDVLDRAGHRPADVVEHRHRMEGALVIEHVRKGDSVPTLDVEFDEVGEQ